MSHRRTRPIFPALLAGLLAFAIAAPVEAGGVNMGNFRTLVIQVLASLGVTDGDGVPLGTGDISGVTAGTGLTGGGASGAVTVNVAVSAGLTAAADEITLDTDLQAMAALVSAADKVPYATGAGTWAL